MSCFLAHHPKSTAASFQASVLCLTHFPWYKTCSVLAYWEHLIPTVLCGKLLTNLELSVRGGAGTSGVPGVYSFLESSWSVFILRDTSPSHASVPWPCSLPRKFPYSFWDSDTALQGHCQFKASEISLFFLFFYGQRESLKKLWLLLLKLITAEALLSSSLGNKKFWVRASEDRGEVPEKLPWPDQPAVPPQSGQASQNEDALC